MELKVNIGFFTSLLDAIENKLCLQTLNKPKGLDIDYNIYKDEYSHNAIDLLKEHKKIIINDKTEYIYLHRASLTKGDVYQRISEFYENIKIINREVKNYLADKLDLTGITIDFDLLRFNSKVDFEKFFREIIPGEIYMNRFVLKVIEFKN
jgi:hypothetical protein